MTTIATDQVLPMLDVDHLAHGLRLWADGLYTTQAAVELLIAHRTWLHRNDFRLACLYVCDDDAGHIEHADICHHRLFIGVHWHAVTDFADAAPAAASETRILRLAASLAGTAADPPHDTLADLTSGLDPTNTQLLLDALAMRAGWHETGHVALVTGRPTALSRANPTELPSGPRRGSYDTISPRRPA